MNDSDQATASGNTDILMSTMPKVAAKKAGRPRVHAERKSTTLRLSEEDYEYVQLLKFLKGMSLPEVVTAALAEYRERHRAEVLELQKEKMSKHRSTR